eukprot:TRINITY_DN14336_c0_g1_i1.p1 TRINITY_DN14336_c0_g1~~TRINITY_DN14336_c0_g1_i1.p1  ORF type:complete len:267 (-),score=87.95 TRINITY_DN14336_c0_g1_i1:214-1014(-)
MLNGRERVGDLGVNWQEYALGHNRTKRKTVGFGTFDKKNKKWSDFEIFVREISIIDGGLGCAIWDAAIIMSRWVNKQAALFKDSTVIELGSGCGLTGIVMARYAKQVYLTDYLDPVIDNLKYNVYLNSMDGEEDEVQPKEIRDKIATTKVAYLNWDEVDNIKEEDDPLPKADVVIGSELTYSPKSVEALVKVIKRYMKPDGVFYELLSTDRDGVPFFVEKMKEAGFTVNIHPVTEEYCGNFNTKQRPENYLFYTCKYAECKYPDMT